MLDWERLLKMKAIFSWTFSGGSTILSVWSVATSRVSMLVVFMEGWGENKDNYTMYTTVNSEECTVINKEKLTGTSFLKLLGVGLAMVLVLVTVVAVVVVVTRVLGCPSCGALRPAGCCDWEWAWPCACANAKLPGVVMEPCIFTGGSRDCWPYSIYCTHRIFKCAEREI